MIDKRLEVPTSAVEPRYDVIGSQVPPIFHAPPHCRFEWADTAIEILEVLCPKLSLFPWQKLVLRNMLARDDGGLWAATAFALIVPRQNGKNVVLAALLLIHMFIVGTPHIVYTAQLMATAKNFFRHLQKLVEDSPLLEERLVKFSESNGNVAIIVESLAGDQSRLDFQSRSRDSIRGLSPGLVVFDEAYQLSQDAKAAAIYATSAQTPRQIVYTSSTGFEDSEVLLELHNQGTCAEDERNPSLTLMEWSAQTAIDTGHSWDSQEAVQASNPSLGYVQRWELILGDEIHPARVSEAAREAFMRERLGLWAKAATAALISPELWDATESHAGITEGNAIVKRALALEVDRDRHAFIAGASLHRDGIVTVDLIEHGPGTAWVADVLHDIRRENHIKTPVIIDAQGGAASLEQVLAAEGIPVRLATTAELCSGTGHFYDLLTQTDADGDLDPGIYHGTDQELTNSALTVVQRFIGQTTRWTWGSGAEVGDEPMRALTLAHMGLTLEPKTKDKKKRFRRRI